MKKNILIAVSAIAILLGLAAYFFWPAQQPKPEPVQVQAPPPPPPVPRQIVEVAPSEPPLPALNDSDHFTLDALTALIANPSLMKLLHPELIIRHIVATVDNLPRKQAPMRVMPLKPVPGHFTTTGKNGQLAIAKKNAARYTPYVQLAKMVDAKQLITLYLRLYPLFQEAYQDLGYPDKYFNDRLIVALDDLLATPNVREPIKLVQPHVLYLFADPDLENRSIGQRILMRIGNQNAALIKTKLGEIRQELMLHMHEEEMMSAK